MKSQHYNGAISSLVILAATYGLSWLLAITIAPTYQAVALRELTETERVKLYLIQKVGYEEYRQWDRIISAESSWNINAYNAKTNDHCLVQVNQRTWSDEAKKLGLDYIHNPIDCIEMGLYIKEKQGWSAWSASRSKWQ